MEKKSGIVPLFVLQWTQLCSCGWQRAANRRPETVQLFSNALCATATMHFNCAGYRINQASLNNERSPCVYPLNNLPRSTAGITTALFWVFILFGSGCCFPTGGSQKFRSEAQMCIFKATSYILPSKKNKKSSIRQQSFD